MKTKDIISCLKANKAVTGYEIHLSHKESRELFYVLRHIEISRAVDTESCSIDIYVSNKKYTGSSGIVVTAADDEKSLNRKIKQAVTKAKQAKNRYYPLAEKTVNIKEDKPEDLDLNDIASKVAKAVFKADTYEEGHISSTEILVSRYKREFYNSNGIHHTSYRFRIQIELVPTWKNKKEEYEVYRFYETAKIDYKDIEREVKEVLLQSKARAEAKPLAKVKLPKNLPVVIQGEMRNMIAEQLSSEMTYMSQYTRNNHYAVNDEISRNPFTVTMKPVVKGAIRSSEYDGNGIVLKEKTIIRKGKACDTYGSLRFGTYLNAENITGSIPVCTIKADGVDFENTKHLLIEIFSSPQLESASGYWGGEVRLAKYYDGKKYIPLSGFSISGSLYDDIKNIRFSKTKTVDSSYSGPKYFIFDNISIF
ncbi:MAG: metallopeptidase TldD-related protein [Erysipelotrichaceae bacterium]|nr:metallopeptidase TldD-related protein [Erysipelotrichaceae bacterium]